MRISDWSSDVCSSDLALLGPSGSGKSTMLQAVGLLEGGFGGIIRIDGEDVTRFDQGKRTKTRREKIGFVYQFHHLLPDFTAIENVVLPQLIRGAGQAEAEGRGADLQIGRTSRRERVCQYGWSWLVAEFLKKKDNHKRLMK